jgi:hypothetical protein
LKAIGADLKHILDDAGDSSPRSCPGISDDLLVKLFLAKLKISFNQDKSSEEEKEEMYELVKKEDELREQLQAAISAGAVDDKKKAAGGKTPEE